MAAIAVFGALALAMVTATRIGIAGSDGRLARARAEAAADAGVAIALHGLIAGDGNMLALIGGGSRRIDFAGARLTVRVTDERGKILLNRIGSDPATRMLELAGLSGDALQVARDSLLDWIDDDDQPHANGAEAPWYAPQGIAPRNGAPYSLDELARVRGFSPALVERLRPYVTVDADALPFDSTHAQPQAVAVMGQPTPDAVAQIESGREQAGQRVALDSAALPDIAGHPLTVAVDADAPGGGHAHREVTALLNTAPGQPYVIHAVR